MKTRPRYGLPAPLALGAPAPSDGPGGPWCVLAYEAELKGYTLPDGSAAKITRQDLEDVVKNFTADPKVPIVLEHADTRRGMPSEWAKPHGWVVALRLGTMQRAGATVTTLEGRLDVPPEVALAINGGADRPPQYPFCSVTLGSGVDMETGADLGTVLWSLSLTAHPRLADVPRLAAGHYYGDVEDRDDLLEMLRTAMGLPALAPEADVMASLRRLAALTPETATAEGIDLAEILECLRSALRLPVLTTAADVLAAIFLALLPVPTPAPGGAGELSLGRAAATTENPTMKFIAMLAAFGLPAVADEDAAEKSVLALAQDGADARKALGVTVGQALAPKVAELVTAHAELAKVNPELATLRAEKATREDTDRAAHVDAVCLAKGWGDEAKPALLAFARQDPTAFAAAYPRPSGTELAQRAQDPERLGRVAGTAREASKEPAPAEAATVRAEAQRLQAVYARAGQTLTTSQAVGMLSRGETPETAARELGLA